MIYDISLPLSPALGVWPGDPGVERARVAPDAGVARWCMSNHAGTHVDAPAHAVPGGGDVESLDPAVLLGPCRVLDLPNLPLITAEALGAHDLAGVERVLLRTRNSRRWGAGDLAFNPEFVGIDATAAELLTALGVKLVGTDGLSIDPLDGAFRAHRRLLAAGVVIVEGLNLFAVPAGDYRLVCAPLRLQDADGAPARAFLVTP